MRLGLIARGDRGGLGAMTQEFARQLHPDRVLGIDLGERGRGPADWSLFDGDLTINHGMDDALPAGVVARFCDGLDVLYSAETLYRADVADIARSVGCRTVLHAMPELWRADLASPDVVWAPTTWALDRLPAGTEVVPVPVAKPLPHNGFTPELSRARDTLALYHVAAPAMLDRNGTRLLFSALREVGATVEVLLAGCDTWPSRVGNVTVTPLPARADYRDVHPLRADLFVLPRRYGGLSLPMQECAAIGMGMVTLDLEPQRQWVPAEGLVPASPFRKVPMAGGEFLIHQARPTDIARVIDRLAANPEHVAMLRRASLSHAADISWDRWRDRYRVLLEGV